MKKEIGIIVAIEIEAAFTLYPDLKELPAPPGFKLYFAERENFNVYILQTGMGEIYAAAGVQFLATKYNISLLINFGVVGGLTKEMKKEKVCVVQNVVHYKYDCSEFMDLSVGQVDGHDSIYLPTGPELVKSVLTLLPGINTVTCCSGDKFISTEEEKSYLHEQFGGDICDMESAGIVLTCELNHIPCLLLKAVSDGLSDGAEGFYNELQNASLVCLKTANEVILHLSDGK